MIIRFARYYIGSGQFASAATLECGEKKIIGQGHCSLSIYAYIVQQSILLRTYKYASLLFHVTRSLTVASHYILYKYVDVY